MTQAILIDGASLTLEAVRRVAIERAPVALAPAARDRVQRARTIVADIVRQNRKVYGVTTGFGKLSDIAIPPSRLAELQANLVRSHSAGVGALLPEAEVRAMMLLRANVIATGRTGARADLVELLAGMLNCGLYPLVPEQGSVGASGDLAPLAQLARTLIGEGALACDGVTGEAEAMLRNAGLEPITLEPKEGITLINGTQAHTAIAALALVDARRLWRAANVAGAMTLEGLLGTPVAFDARLQEARGQVGQAETAAMLRALLADSAIWESHRDGDTSIQDAYSLRCMPQVHGPVLDAIRFAETLVERELNAATDNPLVFENGDVLSGGNFHGQVVALALDTLAIALTNLATISERRIDRLLNPDLNQGLPPFLTRDAGVSSGFMMAQVTAAALASECKVLAHPASVDTIPTDGSKEDVVPMAMAAAWKVKRIVRNVRHVLAIELMCGAQAVDERAPLTPGRGVAEAHRRVRSHVAPLEHDRALTTDIESLATALADGFFDPSLAEYGP
ncbi:MAG TPA: histidine ammonia-lyase [Gemmatimonadaceae bacterium]|nr:histidine ammonia-lyase [Gemmatimonadaceae bacterium]